jgi:hypothetical protein
VGVFAGAFTFGTLLNIPRDGSFENFKEVTEFLAIAFLLFATSLFLAISIPLLLRPEIPNEMPSPTTKRLVVIHIVLISALQLAGFICLDLVLINIGQNILGILGIVLLCMTASWLVFIWYLEYNSLLGRKKSLKCEVTEQVPTTLDRQPTTQDESVRESAKDE